MTQPTRPPAHLPVLTEVLEVPAPLERPPEVVLDLPEVDLSFPSLGDAAPDEVPLPPLSLSIDLAHMAQRVRANVHIQLEHLIEARLREVMAPLLAQHTDALVQCLKAEMTEAMNEMVARAVEQEITRNPL